MRRERLKALLETLTPEEESALWLSARVALPILHRLVTNADCPSDDVAAHLPAAESVAAHRRE
jgi:hypothetical protein